MSMNKTMKLFASDSIGLHTYCHIHSKNSAVIFNILLVLTTTTNQI